jgi:hypothetical protein
MLPFLLRPLKGTVAPVLVWLQVVWLERAKIGKEPLSVFKIFHSFFNNLNRKGAVQRK